MIFSVISLFIGKENKYYISHVMKLQQNEVINLQFFSNVKIFSEEKVDINIFCTHFQAPDYSTNNLR